MRLLCADLLLQRIAQQPKIQRNKQLFNAIRESILDGSLPPMSRLSSSRDLAQQLGMARNTVLTVYEQLLAEGYIQTRIGSGTYVAATTPDSHLSTRLTPMLPPAGEPPVALSQRGQALLAQASASPQQWGTFLPGVPDVTAFPHPLFSRIQARLNRAPLPQNLTYSSQGGSLALRQALVEYLRVARAVHCEPEQILITEGIHQALDLVIRMLCNPGDRAWVEEPSYWGIRHLLNINAVTIQPQPVDEAGMQPPSETQILAPRLIFVTPSHQYPLGAVMSLTRRLQLLALARDYGSWIVEDDYDSEFRFSGQPIPALQGLEANSPVIYIGTFSKTLYPALRIGYLVLPPSLMAPLKRAHGELYRGGHLLIQEALAQFIREGHYSAHIRRMRLLYGRRRAFLVSLIQQHLGPASLDTFNHNAAGLHLILNLPAGSDDVAIATAANQHGVLVRPLSRYYLHPGEQRGLLMGFASATEQDMAAAFKILLTCL
ncbi:MAG: PLP-dependent aminotransferase family protein [Enterobacteriaceae bacterium]